MDTLVRSRRLLLTSFAIATWALAGAFAVACGGARGTGTPVGVSTAGHGKGERIDDAGPDGARRGPGLPADFKTKTGYTKVNRSRFVSNGHASGRWDVDIYVSSSAKEAYAASAGEVPVGARLVKEHFERAGTADASAPTGPIMMMEKMEKGFDPDHGDWRYVVVNSAGSVIEDGRVESCAGCHDDAPHDHIFRVDQ